MDEVRVRISVDTCGDEFHVELNFVDTITGTYRGAQIDEAVSRIKAAMKIEETK